MAACGQVAEQQATTTVHMFQAEQATVLQALALASTHLSAWQGVKTLRVTCRSLCAMLTGHITRLKRRPWCDPPLGHLARRFPFLTHLDLSGCEDMSDEQLGLALGGLTRLRLLDLSGAKQVSTRCLEALARLPALSSVTLHMSRDAEVAAYARVRRALTTLGSLPHLTTFCASGHFIDDLTLERLSSASCLTSVSLRFEAITDSGVAALARLPCLTHLSLATFGTGPARALALTLSALTRLAPQLQELELQNIPASSAAIKAICTLKRLKNLTVGPSDMEVRGLTTEDLAPLLHLSCLTSLALPKLLLAAGAGDSLLSALTSLPTLTSLDLGLTPWGAFTEAGVRGLARTCGSLASVRGSWLSSDTLGALPSLMLLPLPHPHLYRCADADWAVQSLAASQATNVAELTVEASAMSDAGLSSLTSLTRLTSLTVKRCHLWLGGGLPASASVVSDASMGGVTADAVMEGRDDDSEDDDEGLLGESEDLPFPMDTAESPRHAATSTPPSTQLPELPTEAGLASASGRPVTQQGESAPPPPVQHLHVNSCDAITGSSLLGGTCRSLSSTLTSLDLVALRLCDSDLVSHLPALLNLRDLLLSHLDCVTNAMCGGALARMTQLMKLTLANCQNVSGRGLADLSVLTGLESLSLFRVSLWDSLSSEEVASLPWAQQHVASMQAMAAATAAAASAMAVKGTGSSSSTLMYAPPDEYVVGGMSSMTCCYTGAPRHELMASAHAACPGMGAVAGVGHGASVLGASTGRGGAWGGSGGAGVSDLVGAVAMAAAAAEASAASRRLHQARGQAVSLGMAAAAGCSGGYPGSCSSSAPAGIKALSQSPQSVLSLPGSPDTCGGASSPLQDLAAGDSSSSSQQPGSPPAPCSLPAVCALGYSLASLRDITLWRCGWHPVEEDRLHILHSLLHLPSLKTVGLDVGGPAAAAPFHARGCAVEDYAWPVAKRFYV